MSGATRSTGEDHGSNGDVGPGVDGSRPTVTDHLDRVIAAAHEEQMAASELIGLLFYYAHCVAEGHRRDSLAIQDSS